MGITWDDVTGFLKIVPGLVIFPFSIYFAFKKISYRIGCQVRFRNSRVRGNHISSIIFQNHKDRPIAITEIFGIQNNVKFEIEKPKIPILLKGLETIVVKPEEYSKYVCKGELFKVDIAIDKLQIFVVTPEKTIPCHHIFRPIAELEKYYKGLDVAKKFTRTFNDVVYGDDSLFAIVYRTGTEYRTTIIDKHGIMDDFDHLGCNNIPKRSLTSEGIKSYLKMKIGVEVDAFELDHVSDEFHIGSNTG